MITEQEIYNLANKYKIDKFTILREYIQIVFLRDLYNNEDTSKDIYFKGGTSIHFFLNSFRFSEDLDFTTTLSAKKLLDLLNLVVNKLQLEIPGVKLNKIEKKADSFTGRLNYYIEKLKYPLTVKLEFSLREKPQTKKISVLETDYPVAPYPLVVHLDWEEILAEKVRAILIRGKGRDLFDLWFLLSKNIKLDKKLINKKLLWYGKKFVFEDLIKKIKEFEKKEFYQDLNKFLPQTYRKIAKELPKLVLNKLKEA